MRSLIALLLFCTVGACAMVPSQRASFRFPAEVVQTTVALAGIEVVVIEGGVAVIAVEGDGTADVLDLVVGLQSSDAERLERICIPGARLNTRREDARLYVRLDQASRDRCGESWRLRIPPGVALEASATMIDATVNGTIEALAMDASGPSRVRGTVRANSVRVSLGHGDIDLTVHPTEAVDVQARSDNGDVDVRIDGYQISAKERRGPGTSISLDADGHGRIDVRSRLGRVNLSIVTPR